MVEFSRNFSGLTSPPKTNANETKTEQNPLYLTLFTKSTTSGKDFRDQPKSSNCTTNVNATQQIHECLKCYDKQGLLPHLFKKHFCGISGI